jgi:hypothetical protein
MPRTVDEILAQADELSRRFEDAEPVAGTDGAALRAVREAFEDLALTQKRLSERIAVAKAAGHSWATIGAMIGTSGEAARQRYGTPSQGKKAAAGRSSRKATTAAENASTSSARVHRP